MSRLLRVSQLTCREVALTTSVIAGPRLSFTLPSPPGPPLGPPHMRAMSFPGHLLIPGSAFGSHPAPPPGPGTGAGPPVPAAELQTALAAASLGNRSANSGSGPSDSASLPRRPTSKYGHLPLLSQHVLSCCMYPCALRGPLFCRERVALMLCKAQP